MVPASLVINWKREIDMWRPEVADEFDVVSYAASDLESYDARDYKTVIADEAHYLKNPEAKRTMIGCRLLREAERAIAITGTLVPNRPIELWALLFALKITDMGYVDFAFRYCGAYEDDRNRLNVLGATRLRELRAHLKDHVVRYTKEEALPELPAKQWRVLALDLPMEERVKELSFDDLKRMDETVAFEAMSDVLHEHGVRKMPLAIEHVQDLLESEEKVVVFAHHRDVIAGMAGALKEHGVVTVIGGQTQKRRQLAVDLFQQGTPRVFIGQFTAGGVGHTLTAANRVVLAEGSWVPGVLEQAADRCHRIGQAGVVNVDVLTIDGSIDEAMLRRALEKLQIINRIVPTSDSSRGSGVELSPLLQ
jgi:SWI/SNF-related matrix-associated actin-dependent regulator 1 of chromatin subfamily A